MVLKPKVAITVCAVLLAFVGISFYVIKGRQEDTKLNEAIVTRKSDYLASMVAKSAENVALELDKKREEELQKQQETVVEIDYNRSQEGLQPIQHSGGDWRSIVIPKEQQLARERWGSQMQADALTNVLDNENYTRDPFRQPPEACAYGIAQKIDGWDGSYVEGDVDGQLVWVANYISSRYGDAVSAWLFKLANGWY